MKQVTYLFQMRQGNTLGTACKRVKKFSPALKAVTILIIKLDVWGILYQYRRWRPEEMDEPININGYHKYGVYLGEKFEYGKWWPKEDGDVLARSEGDAELLLSFTGCQYEELAPVIGQCDASDLGGKLGRLANRFDPRNN